MPRKQKPEQEYQDPCDYYSHLKLHPTLPAH